MSEKKETYRFGEKIKKVRERQKLTLKSLSEKIGVSSSLLSQIENNRVSPSLDTLIAITDELDIDLEYLFKDLQKPRKVKIVHKEDRDHLSLQQVSYERLSPPIDSNEAFAFETLELTIEANGQRGNDEFGHPGREMGIILEGTAQLIYGNKLYSLEVGDSVSFSSHIPHTLKNLSDTKLKAIWIISPPRVFNNEG